MSNICWRKRSREARAPAANAVEFDRPLEGPSAEQRLRRIQARFRKALGPRDLNPRSLVVLSFLIFLAVVGIGLIVTQ